MALKPLNSSNLEQLALKGLRTASASASFNNIGLKMDQASTVVYQKSYNKENDGNDSCLITQLIL